jgi:uncharacterized protein (TIGR04255 family)
MQPTSKSNSDLPSKLGREPLIDVVFEIRFEASVPASSVFPGILFSQLEGDKRIERLPIAEFPAALRDADPNLKFAPIGRLVWGDFVLPYGDQSVAIGCKIPYVGWSKFKDAILKVIGLLAPSGVMRKITRLGLKYVDLIERPDLASQIQAVNLKLSLADHYLQQEAFQLRIEIPRDGFINAIQLASGVTVSFADAPSRTGLIVDVDTVLSGASLEIDDFNSKIESLLDEMHFTNKAIFFDVLTKSTISSLEPIYAAAI